MRADRLVRLLMLLQTRGKLSVGVLARELQVSERTVHRDLDALSTSGVPVYATRGASGGVALVDGWRTQLTGLTRTELHALALVGAPGALEDLALAAPLQSGLLKLSAALPDSQRPTLEFARQRLHLDVSSWFTGRERVPHLEALREAVWLDRRVRLGYRDMDGHRSVRTVDPYGLVIKADRWYLVAGTSRGPSVFRGSRVESARVLPLSFRRPERFALAVFWKEWCARFAEQRARYEVLLRLTPEGEAALRRERPPADQARFERASRAADGTKTVHIDFEREGIALSQLCAVGRGVEVLEPEALRTRLASLAEALGALYGRPAARRTAGRGRRD